MRACKYCGKLVPESNPPLLRNFCDNNHRLFYKRNGGVDLPERVNGKVPACLGIWGRSPRAH